jgi:hypothetical protein
VCEHIMSQPQSFQDWPLKDIPAPHPHDVLCGRGGGSNSHVGNIHWRMLVADNKELYVTLPKRQKLLLSMSIVNAVRSQNPPGRFLQKDENNLYYDVGDQRAQEKTSQGLREGASEVKKRMGVSPAAFALNPASTGPPNQQPCPAADFVLTPTPAAHPSFSSSVPVALPTPVAPQGPVPIRNKKKASGRSVPMAQGGLFLKHLPALDRTHAPPASNDVRIIANSIAEQLHMNTSAAQSHDAEQDGDSPTRTMISDQFFVPPVDGGLEPASLSFGTYMSLGTLDSCTSDLIYSSFQNDPPEPPSQQQHGQDEDPLRLICKVAPVDGGLEPQSVSFGHTVMSIDSMQLERAGQSISSLMSIATMPAAVDGGFEAIGTSFGSMSISREVPTSVDGGLQDIGPSFGSLSLSAEDRELLIASLKEDNVDVPAALASMPTFLSAQRSTTNLLECTDTESEEDEESRPGSSANPSADWEKLKATISAQNVNLAANGQANIPPPFVNMQGYPACDESNHLLLPNHSPDLYIPTTGFDRDLSALSVGDYDALIVADLNEQQDDLDRLSMPPPPKRELNPGSMQKQLNG